MQAASHSPQSVLHEVFGYEQFRGPQAAIVDHVIAGGDALVLMPTGGGKSLCYQIPAIARQRAGHGVTLVVSPLIALMHDQVGALHEAGVQAEFLNSTLSGEQANAVEKRMLRGEVTLVYAAPERVTTARFLAQLDSLYERGQLALFAIDEAHCVSQWGHDFRPEYRALTVLHERYPQVPRMALTATADAITRADILERLQLQDAGQFIGSFDRPNIVFLEVVPKKDATSTSCCASSSSSTPRARRASCTVPVAASAEEIHATLSGQGIRARPYHAGARTRRRQRNQERFLREERIVIVATIAFGMGINKPNVRFVVHLRLAQEHRQLLPGDRAGRPRRAARRRMDGVRTAGRREPAPHDRRKPGGGGFQAGDARQARCATPDRPGAQDWLCRP